MGFLYINYDAVFRQTANGCRCKEPAGNGIAATIIIGMKPRTIGRTLGIGLRVAGRVAGQRVAEGAQPSADGAPTGVSAQAQVIRAEVRAASRDAREEAGQAAVRTVKGVGRGVGGFLRPLQRVGSIVWLEVMGVFFLLFVVVFAPTLWRTRMSYAHGPDHRTFLSAGAITVVFLYLSVTSFWKARKK